MIELLSDPAVLAPILTISAAIAGGWFTHWLIEKDRENKL